MKMAKKKVFVAALAICLVAIISMGTLAWFNAQDEVTNKFMIADSDDDTPDEIFSVDVWENTPDGEKDQDGYEYTDILPGDTLKKEARVENTGHYDQYVRVTVTISDAQAWIDALGANFSVADVFDGFVAADWNHIWNNMNGATTIPENFVYVMYYKDIVKPGDVINVFNNVKIPTSLTREEAVAFGGNFDITVKAEAVQTENVVPEGTAAADAAWAAFKTVEGNN